MRHSIIITSAVVSAITSAMFGATILVPDEYGSIQAGIDAANPGDTVLVSAGIYYETIDFGGKEITVLSADGEPSGTYIDGNVSTGSVVSFITGETDLSILDGFTIRNGSATSGGGVYIQSASPILRNCVISGNSTTNGGGGIFIDSGTLTLENTTVKGNTSNGAGGGAYLRYSEGSIVNSTFENNSAVNGGAIYVKEDSGDLILTNIVIQGNSATASGGGVFETKQSNIIVSESAFTDNMANKGGAWFSYLEANATISNTTFVGNTVSESGGAANIRSLSELSFVQCVFEANIADNDCDGIGGSGAIEITTNSKVTLENPTICVNLVCDVIEDFSDAQPNIIGDIFGCSSGLGACCGGTACWVMDYNSCLEGGGVFNGEDTLCEMVNCMDMDAGACCLDNQCIIVISSDSCADAGGDFQGELIECIDVVCVGCPADLNGDGSVEVNDIIEVITSWGACP